MTITQLNSSLAAALQIARSGIPIHPLHTPTPDTVAFDGSPRTCSCNRPGCESNGKHPRTPHGCKDATTDTAHVERWFRTWPGANVGIATGHPLPRGGYLTVVDIDPDHGGRDSLAQLLNELGALPPTYTVRTGGDGDHFYFRTPQAVRNRGGLRPGIDIRGTGGYVVAAGSLHASGDRYTAAAGSLDDIAWLPDSWLELIGARAPAQSSGRAGRVPVSAGEWGQLFVNGVSEGGRNNATARVAGYLLARGLPGRDVLARVIAWNDARNRPPLPRDEIEKVVRSIADRQLAKQQEVQR